jgi:hypothetical protein
MLRGGCPGFAPHQAASRRLVASNCACASGSCPAAGSGGGGRAARQRGALRARLCRVPRDAHAHVLARAQAGARPRGLRIAGQPWTLRLPNVRTSAVRCHPRECWPERAAQAVGWTTCRSSVSPCLDPERKRAGARARDAAGPGQPRVAGAGQVGARRRRTTAFQS